MYKVYDKKSLNEFRSEQREAEVKKAQLRQRLDEEQKERIRKEQEQNRKPLHEEMKDKVSSVRDTLQNLQPGDVYAVSTLRNSLLSVVDILTYILEKSGDGEQAKLGGSSERTKDEAKANREEEA